MKRRHLPLQGLLYFYKSAELCSFKLAAQDLCVSPAAVSQQIRQLEATLDTSLFTRNHRTIGLTPSGENLYQEVKLGFRHLQAGVDALTADERPNQLSISAPSSFAHHWLIPRLQAFRAQFPDISILVEPTNRLTSPDDTRVDVCVRFGSGQYAGMHSEWLMDDAIYPVCHPHYQQEFGIETLADLQKAALIEDIHTDMRWETWLNEHHQPVKQPTLLFDGSQFVVESALAMQGVGLIKHSLAQRYIQNGTLVRIDTQQSQPQAAYFICLPEKNLQRPKVRCFIQWLKQQIAGDAMPSARVARLDQVSALDSMPERHKISADS
ncbi:LysR family transcriptional regulator [Vibrio fluvialis]|nr:LysR family transcriptional regulator [Vibrio fluvialis]